MSAYVQNGVTCVKVPAANLRIQWWDKPKMSAAAPCANAGFFGTYVESGETFTLPVGHLRCDVDSGGLTAIARGYMEERGTLADGKFAFDSGAWGYNNALCGNAVSTLILKDGEAGIVDAVTLPECDYAIAGIPVIRNGADVKFLTYVKGQGWTASALYATQHIFAGIMADDPTNVYIMSYVTKTANLIYLAEMWKLLKDFGFSDVIKLDGGGSTRFDDGDGTAIYTAENRQINTILTWTGADEKAEIISGIRALLDRLEAL